MSSATPLALESAKAAGLRYVYDTKPGITRKPKPGGKTFRYYDTANKLITDKAEIDRIHHIVIPPAWTDVWICPNPNGHLQATGRDARGRKQSRYHPRWRATRDEAKYERMILFGHALPGIRERVDHDLALPGLPREKVLATVVRLMETTFIRVGNEEYARTNHSYGLTTLRNKHVGVKGSTITFDFKGKSGVEHHIDITDRRLARIVQRCHDTPGYELFTYLDADNNPHTIDSSDVNAYLDSLTPPDSHFTAKDFRTWAGTVLASVTLQGFAAAESEPALKKNVVEAIKTVSERLGNTPAVCRKCYVHPLILETYLSGNMLEAIKRLPKPTAQTKLRPEEHALLSLLQHQLKPT